MRYNKKYNKINKKVNKAICFHYIRFINRLYNLPTVQGFSYAVEILSYINDSVEKTGILATISSELQG